MPSISFSQFDGGIDLSRPANIQDANRFRMLRNAFVTPGKTVRKRPGARYRWSWGEGVKGLFSGPGYLTGFYGDGNDDAQAVTEYPFQQSAGRFLTTKLQADGGGAAPGNMIAAIRTAFMTTGGMYVVADTDVGVRHFFVSGAADNAITDERCPQWTTAIPIASKVFAGDATGVVRFSATDNPADWSAAEDAGFLPTDRKTRSLKQVVALGEFDGQLVVSTGDAAQLWSVDPDPQAMSYQRTLAVGQVAGDTGANVGADLFFASPTGVRSIVLNSQHGNAMDLDVGVPVDKLAVPMFEESLTLPLLARYFPSLGQFWLIRGRRALVYSFSRTAKVYAWSEYEFPWPVTGAADFAGAAWLRSAAGDIYELDPEYQYDDDADRAVAGLGEQRDPGLWTSTFPNEGRTIPAVLIETPFFDMKSPAALKQIHAMDVVATRDLGNTVLIDGLPLEYRITHLFRSDSASRLFEAGPIGLFSLGDDTRPQGVVPVGLMAPSIAARIEHQAPESFELSALIYHFDNLGVTG